MIHAFKNMEDHSDQNNITIRLILCVGNQIKQNLKSVEKNKYYSFHEGVILIYIKRLVTSI